MSSTRSVRGSTSTAHGFPFTVSRNGTFSNTSDIFVPDLHTFSTRAPHRDIGGALHQRSNQHALVVRRPAHVRLRFARGHSRLRRILNALFVNGLSAQGFLRGDRHYSS